MEGAASRAMGPNVVAGGTIIPMRAIKLSGAAARTALQSGAGEVVLGIAQQGQKRAPGLVGSDDAVAAEAGDQLDYYGPGDVCPAVAGAATTLGGLLKSDANGKLVNLSTTGYACAIGLEAAGADGDVIEVLVISPFFRG